MRRSQYANHLKDNENGARGAGQRSGAASAMLRYASHNCTFSLLPSPFSNGLAVAVRARVGRQLPLFRRKADSVARLAPLDDQLDRGQSLPRTASMPALRSGHDGSGAGRTASPTTLRRVPSASDVTLITPSLQQGLLGTPSPSPEPLRSSLRPGRQQWRATSNTERIRDLSNFDHSPSALHPPPPRRKLEGAPRRHVQFEEPDDLLKSPEVIRRSWERKARKAQRKEDERSLRRAMDAASRNIDDEL